METTVRTSDAEKLGKTAETLKMNAANEEIKFKSDTSKTDAEKAQEKVTKEAWADKQRAAAAAQQQLDEGNKETDLMMQKFAAQDEAFAAIHAQVKEKAAQAKAELAQTKSEAEQESLKEANEKKVAKDKKEIETKTATAAAHKEVIDK